MRVRSGSVGGEAAFCRPGGHDIEGAASTGGTAWTRTYGRMHASGTGCMHFAGPTSKVKGPASLADPRKSQPSRDKPTPPVRPSDGYQRETERLADFRAIQGTDERNYAGMAQTDKLERTGAQKQLSHLFMIDCMILWMFACIVLFIVEYDIVVSSSESFI